MTISNIVYEFYKASKKIKYNYRKVYCVLHCCMKDSSKESYKFDTLVYNDTSIKLFYKKKLVAELTKENCVWINAIYMRDKYMCFKLVDYYYEEVE